MRNDYGGKIFRTALFAVAACGWCAGARGDTWWVNNETGRDNFDGRSAEAKGDGVHGPFATFKRAAAALKTSDRLEIANTSRPYREILSISKGGVPDAPLVVDGHGATIDALGLVPAAQWKAEPDGLFSTPFATNANKLERVKDVMTWIGAPQIWFVDGQPAANAKSPQELSALATGFYWNKGEHRLYFKPPAGKNPADLHVEIPLRGTGIVVHGVDHVVVQNFRSLHSLNDGVGTGHCTAVVFRNIEGCDNCDQGFSAHGGAVNIIEDCSFQRNAGSGICDVNNSVTIFRRCLIAHNTFESGAFFLDDGFHVLEDCAIVDNDDGPQVIAGGQCAVQLRNCVVCGKAGNAKPLLEADGGRLTLDSCTVTDGTVGARLGNRRGELRITNSLFARCSEALVVVPKGAETRFTSNYNGWQLGVMHFGDVGYTAETWADYRKISQQDTNSLTAEPLFPAGAALAADSSLAAVFAAFSLPAESAYLHAGEKGHRIGAAAKTPK
jgi:hypothetical protein